ncbi:MAG: SusD/RagB family nutrient-binding outer membrane lipoprotein [Mediterranea sp.]|jgi:hypothetical protein|nr:SusD/RagB family nutrient-binding outer membrane lipoprotein [Mediterranea sp.]
MNKIYRISLTLLTALLASCTGKYLDINTEPYVPQDVNADDYALGAAMNNLASCVVSPDVNTCQFTECLLGGPMAGYFADSNAGWANTISNYNAKDDWTRVFMQTDRIIPVLYSNLAIARQVSEDTGNPVPLAIANIIKVATMHRVTDTYGPIPYSKIGENGALNAPYDSQQEVYNLFFEELDTSIAALMENQNRSLTASADYIYAGDVRKWIRFANSLKLRLAIRIAYADPATAKVMAESAIRNEIGVITTNADNAKWDYFKTSVNPFYTATRYNAIGTHDDGTTCLTGGDTHAAADIICYMNGYNDPRREKFFTRSEWMADDGVTSLGYVGMRHGITIPALKASGHKYSGVNVIQSDPIYWMNAAEVAFLRAEGTAIFAFDMGGTAREFYEQGITLSFEQWGAAGADTYMADDTSKPTTYTDPSGADSYQNTLSDITVKWDEEATAEQKQERIITQKWIANWMLGNEAWADYRRTGYPHLIPASAAGNKSGGVVDSNKGARRMPWPIDEYSNNAENMPAALQALGGTDNMATDVWWAKRN